MPLAALAEPLRTAWRKRFGRWLANRNPRGRRILLNQRRLFIFPSRMGLLFALLLLLILLIGINYQNNLAYAVAFLLASLFVVAVLHTYANLAGLSVEAVRAGAVFPGQRSRFSLRLGQRENRPRYALRLSWAKGESEEVNLGPGEHRLLHFSLPVGERGWFHPGRLLVESRYPLGLLRCWTWLDLDLAAVVYPAPRDSGETALGAAADGSGGSSLPRPGNEDFQGFRDYRPGDSLRHVHWKGLARGQSMQSKQYHAWASRERWLDWEDYPGLPQETRLSQLCHLALQWQRREQPFGLRLPGSTLQPDRGPAHLEAVLTALALYRREAPPA